VPEYNKIEDLPEFNQKSTDYQIALREAGDDESLQLKAKLAWSEERAGMENRRHTDNENHRKLLQTAARLKEQYGDDVPEGVYASKTSPDEMEQAAKEFNDVLQARLGQQAPPPTPGSTGQPPSGVSANQPPANPENAWADRLAELRSKINAGQATHAEVEEFQNIRINMQMIPAHEKARQEAGHK